MFCIFLSRDLFVKVQSAFPRKEPLSVTDAFSSSAIYLFLLRRMIEMNSDGSQFSILNFTHLILAKSYVGFPRPTSTLMVGTLSSGVS